MNVLVLIGRLTTKKVFIPHFHISYKAAYYKKFECDRPDEYSIE